MTETQTIPQALADRYLTAFTALVSKGRDAVAAGSSPQTEIWKQRVLPLLELRLTAAKSAAAHYAIGDDQPLVIHARQSLSLGRDMDGYSLDFAGEEFAEQLKLAQQMVVFAAWYMCQSAGAV